MKNTITLLLILLICFGCKEKDADKIMAVGIVPYSITIQDKTPSTYVYGEDTIIILFSQSDSGYITPPKPSPLPDTTITPPDPFNIMKWYWDGFPKNYNGWAIEVEEIFYFHGWTEGYKLDRLNAYCDTCDYLDKYSFDIFLDYGNSEKTELSVEQNRDTTDKYMSLKYPEYFPMDTTKPPLKDKIKMQPRWRDVRLGGNMLVDTFISTIDTIMGAGGKPFCNDIIWDDTTKVIMLVADTSSQNGFRSSRCFWMYGYSAYSSRLEKIAGSCLDKNDKPTTECYIEIIELIYLDESKFQLKKNIVVWISKELK